MLPDRINGLKTVGCLRDNLQALILVKEIGETLPDHCIGEPNDHRRPVEEIHCSSAPLPSARALLQLRPRPPLPGGLIKRHPPLNFGNRIGL